MERNLITVLTFLKETTKTKAIYSKKNRTKFNKYTLNIAKVKKEWIHLVAFNSGKTIIFSKFTICQ